MKKSVKATLAVAATSAAIAGVIAVPSLVSAWGDNSADGKRPSYTREQIESGKLGDSVVLNSISDSVNGNEKNFVSARVYDGDNEEGKDNIWEVSDITVKDGQEYIIRLYVHNNSPKKENVARDVHTRFQIPSASGKQVQVNGFVEASNTTPTKYWSYVNFNSTSDFHLEYVYGSAMLYNNGVGAKGLQLSDDVVKKQDGQMIGYRDYRKNPEDPVVLDGIIPGCYQFASYVTIRVKAVFDTDFRVSQKVRLVGDDTWHNYVDAKVGDKIEIQTEYRNTDFRDHTHENVTMKAILPKNLKYVPGSTLLFTTQTPNGVKKEEGIAGNGIYIGTYGKNSNAYVRFTAEVVDETLVCGKSGIVNWVQAGVGAVVLQDFATIRISKTCEGTPNELPNTGPEAMVGGVAAAGSVVTAAGYYIASRRALR